MTSDSRNVVGLDFEQFQGMEREALNRALRRDPDVLVIYSPSVGDVEQELVQVALESGHTVIETTDKAHPGTEWLINLGV